MAGSGSGKRQKLAHQSKVLTEEVDKTQRKYCYNKQFQDYSNFYNLHNLMFNNKKCSAVMQTESIILCEANAGLWDKTVISAVNSITQQSYPHYAVVKELINYVFKVYHDKKFGLVEEFFWKLLLTHPPRQDMTSYYLNILGDHFVILNEEVEEQSLFFCLLSTLSTLLNTPDISQPYKKKILSPIQNFDDESNNLNNKNINEFSLLTANCENVIDFKTLSLKEKVKRCLIVLNFVLNIFETDFAFWLHSRTTEHTFSNVTNRPLITHMLCSQKKDVDSLTEQFLNLYHLIIKSHDRNPQCMLMIDRLVNLVAEVIRYSDFEKGEKYPFLGKKSVNFAGELLIHVFKHLIDGRSNNWLLKENELIISSKPPWLRLLLCSNLLSYITKYQCPPELTGAFYLLDHIAHCKMKKLNNKTNLEKTSLNLKKVIQGPYGNQNSETSEATGSVLFIHNFNQESLRLSKNVTAAPILNQCKKNSVRSACNHKEIELKKEDMELVGTLCIEMIQSYFCTYNTWDIHKTLKKKKIKKPNKALGFSKKNIEWDSNRYYQDIEINIPKLKGLTFQLSKVQEFQNLHTIYAILFPDTTVNE